MPRSYTRNEVFTNDVVSDDVESVRHHLPAPPLYVFERFASSERTLVMQRSSGNDNTDFGATPTAGALWPKRIIFTHWRFDLAQTLALEPKRKLPSLPRAVNVEVLTVFIPDGLNWKGMITRSNGKGGSGFYNYDLVPKIREIKVLSQQHFQLGVAASTLLVPAMKRPGERTEPRLQVRGLCGDPNPKLLHFKWKMAGGWERWAIAHRSKLRPFLQEGHNFLFMRFKW